MKFRLLALVIIWLCFSVLAQAQTPTPTTRIVVSYTGPRGAYPTVPGINTGPEWPAITHGTFASSPVDYLWPLVNNQGSYHQFFVTRSVTTYWLCGPDAMGSIYPFDQSGEPDYIVLRIGSVNLTTGMREVRMTRYKNGAWMNTPITYYLPHVLNTNIVKVY